MLYRRYHAAQKARREAELASWNADLAAVSAVATPEPVAAKPSTPAPAAAQPQQQNKHQQHPNQRR